MLKAWMLYWIKFAKIIGSVSVSRARSDRWSIAALCLRLQSRKSKHIFKGRVMCTSKRRRKAVTLGLFYGNGPHQLPT